MDEYVPTIRQVRDGYRFDPENEYRDPENAPVWANEAGRAFDRWIAAHDAQVKAEALREAAVLMRFYKDSGHWNLRDPRDPYTSYSPDRWLDVYADRIEQETTR